MKSDNIKKKAFPTHLHLHFNFIKNYTSYLNKQLWKRKSIICLTIIHAIEWQYVAVVLWIWLWNCIWIHIAGLLTHFERKLLSGGAHKSTRLINGNLTSVLFCLFLGVCVAGGGVLIFFILITINIEENSQIVHLDIFKWRLVNRKV